MGNLTRKARKEVRQEEAKEREVTREAFLNKHGREGYVYLLDVLNLQFPTGAVKEKAKYNKIINSIKE
tara:strand:+ start:2855 stop:3058 length:204 start_codon:yes stop_codon:yes gene_type:complete